MTDSADSPSTAVHVSAPSRLHFGLLTFGHASGRCGGAGVMIDQPQLRLSIRPADEFGASGPHAERAIQAARQYLDVLGKEARCRIEIETAPDQHVGLGCGTQLCLAIGAGLNAFLRLPKPLASELAQVMGRGARSLVGTHGFHAGGLLYEGDRDASAGEPQVNRIEFPIDWRWVTIRPHSSQGLSGSDERKAFADLPPVPPSITEELRFQLFERLMPAARSADFDRFGESLHRYGIIAGNCFASRQGGPFASARVALVVEMLRSMGIVGVGQSSWGPTVFALLPDESEANKIRERLHNQPNFTDDEFVISKTNNTGAQIKFCA